MPNDDKLSLSGRNVKKVSNNYSKDRNHHAFTLRPGWDRGDGEDFLELVSQIDKPLSSYFNSFLTSLPLSEKLLSFNRKKI